MPKINVKIDILDILTKRNEALSLNEIKKKLKIKYPSKNFTTWIKWSYWE
jgi:hypothetical protein